MAAKVEKLAESILHAVEEEFGHVAGTRVEQHNRLDSDLSDISACLAADGGRDIAQGDVVEPGFCRRKQWRRLRSRLWHRRWLRQYFREEGVLVREKELRKIGWEELYLDLIIVANIAVIGHDLQTTFVGWKQVETFMLLFGAVYTSWRNVAFLWNMFGTKGDLLDKVGIYFAHAAMSGIGLGAHGAFANARIQVALSAFLASAIPIVSHIVFAVMEPATKNEHNLFNQAVGAQTVALIGVVPYFCAVFVRDEVAVRALYWIALGWTFVAFPLYNIAYRALHAKRPKARRVAVNIESLVEKYGVLTLIVLGESLLALLFQGLELVSVPGAHINSMYAATAASVVIVYSVQTLYFNIDQNLSKGSVHALRHNGRLGMLWGQLHLPYQMALAGFMPTGLAFFIHTITLSAEKGSSTKAISRTALETTSIGSEGLTSNARILFSAGWGLSILLSSIMALTHKAGPKEGTKNIRVICRMVIVTAVAVGVPFASISPSTQLAIFAVLSCAIAVIEFILVEADRIGMVRGKPLPSTAPSSADVSRRSSDFEESDDESSEMDPADDPELAKPRHGAIQEKDGFAELAVQRLAERDARRRQRLHGCKFEAIYHPHLCSKKASAEQS